MGANLPGVLKRSGSAAGCLSTANNTVGGHGWHDAAPHHRVDEYGQVFTHTHRPVKGKHDLTPLHFATNFDPPPDRFYGESTHPHL
jgi:hypothetical protein